LDGQVIEPEAVREMSAALEQVCRSFGAEVSGHAATRLVAEKIIALSRRGARGVVALHEAAVREFNSAKYCQQIFYVCVGLE